MSRPKSPQQSEHHTAPEKGGSRRYSRFPADKSNSHDSKNHHKDPGLATGPFHLTSNFPMPKHLIKKRSIHDNFLYVRNLTRRFHVKKTPTLLFKLDISKAFDSVRWDYLLSLL
jgi:hypothetical protein